MLLVLGIHNVTEIFVYKYEEYIGAGIIVIIFALFKVFIEDKILKPFLERRGWKVYKRNIKVIKDNLDQAYTLFEIVKKLRSKE